MESLLFYFYVWFYVIWQKEIGFLSLYFKEDSYPIELIEEWSFEAS